MQLDQSISKAFVARAVAVVGGGGLIFGYDIGVISVALGLLRSDFSLSVPQSGLLVSIASVGAVFGSLWGGYLSDHFGRWRTIQVQNAIFVVGVLIIVTANTFSQVCIGRCITGIAEALTGIADVPYLVEISPKSVRGVVSGSYELLVCVGVLFAFVVGVLAEKSPYGWRIMFSITGVLALFQSLAMFYIPESPKWLAEHCRQDEAREVMKSMYGTDSIESSTTRVDEIARVIAEEQGSLSTEADYGCDGSTDGDQTGIAMTQLSGKDALPSHSIATQHTNSHHIHHLLQSPPETPVHVVSNHYLMVLYWYPLVVVILLQILCQFTGGNVIRSYAPTIFKQAGYDVETALQINVGLGGVKLVVIAVSTYLMEHAGRKNLLLWSTYIVGAGMLLLAVGFSLSSNSALFIGGCALCIGGYSVGYGPVPWVLSAEMFPTRVRGLAMSVSLVASNCAQAIINFAFLPIVEATSPAATFGILCGINLVATLFVWSVTVETREAEPAEIMEKLYHTSACKTVHHVAAALGSDFCCCSAQTSSLPQAETPASSASYSGKEAMERVHDLRNTYWSFRISSSASSATAVKGRLSPRSSSSPADRVRPMSSFEWIESVDDTSPRGADDHHTINPISEL